MHFRSLLGVTSLLAAIVVPASAQALRPGYLTGITTSAGAPLGGVELRVFGTTDAGQRSSLNTRSKADGAISLRLPSGNFSLRHAVWPTQFEGRAYRLPLYLHGENNDDFDSTEGAAVRLELRMSGETSAKRPSNDETGWFGGLIELDFVQPDGRSVITLPPDSRIIVDLQPRTALMDGSASRPLRFERPLSWKRSDRMILDVPLAAYEAKVTLVHPTGPVEATVSSREGISSAAPSTPAPTAPVTFAPKAGEVTLLSTGGTEKCVLLVVVP